MTDLRLPRRPPSYLRWSVILTLLLVVAAACGSSAPSASPSASPSAVATASAAPVTSASPAPSEDPAAIYDAIEQQVIAIRGLQPTKSVERQLIDEAELRTMLTRMFDEETPPAYLAAQERLYKALGLIPQDADLRDLSLDLLSGGVAAFYRPDQGKAYVVSRSGGVGGAEKLFFAHEYDHALQDQAWTVFKDQRDVLDRGDWRLARLAVSEGDATLLMSQWLLGNATPEDVQDALKASTDPAQVALLERIPAILKEPLLFPYQTGLTFVQAQQSEGGWAAVDRLYERMPESTEQILHPEKYTAGEAPVAVDLPADLATRLGTGWTVPMLDTFGELQTGIWLREGGVDAEVAGDAAAGWGGDRMAVIEGPDDSWALAWHTVWDTPADAAAFETAAATALTKAGGIGQVLPGTGGTSRWVLVASDAETMSQVAGVLELAG